MDVIPVIDLVKDKGNGALDTLHKAFSDIGFVFIKHSLITHQKVRKYNNYNYSQCF